MIPSARATTAGRGPFGARNQGHSYHHPVELARLTWNPEMNTYSAYYDPSGRQGLDYWGSLKSREKDVYV